MARKLAFGNVFENWVKKSKLQSRGSSKESLSLSRKSGRSHESKSSLAKFSDTTRPCEIAWASLPSMYDFVCQEKTLVDSRVFNIL